MIMFSDKASDQPNCSALELEVVVTPWVDEQEKYISRASLETRSKVLALVKVTLCVTNLRHAMLMKIVVSLVCAHQEYHFSRRTFYSFCLTPQKLGLSEHLAATDMELQLQTLYMETALFA